MKLTLLLSCSLLTAAHAQVAADKTYAAKPALTTSTVALPPPAPLVGGADDCTTPDVLVGVGPHAFSTFGAATGGQGQAESLCSAYATTVISNDVWFTWNATFTGYAAVNSCSGGGNDSRLAVYAGNTCPLGAALGCNDDACNYESRTVFPVTLGSDYLIQLGEYPPGVGGIIGNFTFDAATQQGPDGCAAPLAISGPGPFDYTCHGQTTGLEGQAEPLCLSAATLGISNDSWYAWTSAMSGTALVSFCGPFGSGDGKCAVYDASTCPTTPAIACADDTCGLLPEVTFPVTCGHTYLIQVGKYPGGGSRPTGQFTIALSSPVSCNPGVAYCFGDGLGTSCPCSPVPVPNGAPGNGCPNSLNPAGSNLAASGTASVTSDSVVLHGSGMPNAAALYYQGNSQTAGGLGAVFGDGLRCAQTGVIRLKTVNNVGGVSQYPENGSDPLISVRGLVNNGDTKNYQCWYRNAAAFCTASTFNLTNGVSILWGP